MTDRAFDPSLSYRMAQFKTVLGHNLTAGTPVKIDDDADGSEEGVVDVATARLLWNRGALVTDGDFRPTPVETPEQEAVRLAEIEELGGGWWMIRAPWLKKAVKVQGEAEARAEFDRIVSERSGGEPAAIPTAEVPPSEPPGVVELTDADLEDEQQDEAGDDTAKED